MNDAATITNAAMKLLGISGPVEAPSLCEPAGTVIVSPATVTYTSGARSVTLRPSGVYRAVQLAGGEAFDEDRRVSEDD